MWNWSSSSSGENNEMLEKYATFVQLHGELCEDKIEPLNAEDIRVLTKRKRRITTIRFLAIGLSVVIWLVYIIFAPVVVATDFLYMALITGFIALGGWMFLRQLKNALSLNKKRVVSGVVTSKMKLNKSRRQAAGCYFEISGRYKFQVWPGDYKDTALGDIVRIEMVTDDMLIRRVVVKVGKM